MTGRARAAGFSSTSPSYISAPSVDADAHTLEVYRLDGESYRLLDTYADDAPAASQPFDVFTLELGVLWMR